MLVVADLEQGEQHNLVMDKFFEYLRTQSGIERVYYARDSEYGSPRYCTVQSEVLHCTVQGNVLYSQRYCNVHSKVLYCTFSIT